MIVEKVATLNPEPGTRNLELKTAGLLLNTPLYWSFEFAFEDAFLLQPNDLNLTGEGFSGPLTYYKL